MKYFIVRDGNLTEVVRVADEQLAHRICRSEFLSDHFGELTYSEGEDSEVCATLEEANKVILKRICENVFSSLNDVERKAVASFASILVKGP
jgi:hypothetical protein